MAEMNPADVPRDLVHAASAVYWPAHSTAKAPSWETLRAILAVVLPLHAEQVEQQVRERIAADPEFVEWTWQLTRPDGSIAMTGPAGSEEQARNFVANQIYSRVVRRDVTEWREVEGGGGE